jgi:hypothetical protein
VDERAWLQCDSPALRLAWLKITQIPSERKLRLFAAACCRRIWSLLLKETGPEAVQAAERYADGVLSLEELVRVREQTDQARTASYEPVRAAAANTALRATWVPGDKAACQGAELKAAVGAADEAAAWAAVTATMAAGRIPGEAAKALRAEERRSQCRLLHDIFGPLPFRHLPPLAPGVLAWNGGTIPRLAQAAYDERLMPEGTLDRTRLAVLADALEEAGCTDEELLGHLRGPGPHVRGCWAVDLLLGKG